ncbi:MAG: carboxylating nicotinate-nucleotide diphosphorylase [Candidatus Omnitrophica bacterium]|nr:carboxylating nicotinate-nucleotide diphosphorylase [Candidatus Omnitrophota bacterium]
MKLDKEKVFPIIINALTEDMGSGDVTSELLFGKDVNVMAGIFAKGDCILAGIDVARWLFQTIDEKIIFRPLFKDGDRIKKGKKIIFLKGSAKNILAGERTALNFIGRLSGIATLTDRFVGKVKEKSVKIFDTRKTTPGIRILEKYAVTLGGGYNHRMGLWDGILIKDNHLAGLFQGGIKDVLRIAKARGHKNVEIEVNDLKEFKEALDAGADIIMLDNMDIEDIRKAVKLCRGFRLRRTPKGKGGGASPLLEVSGGVTLENVAKLAKTGIDRISIGFLTHSAPSIDFSLEI